MDLVLKSAARYKVSIRVLKVNTFPDDKNLTLSKLKAFADDNFNACVCVCGGGVIIINRIGKTLLENEKMLVTSIFPFSNNVLKRPPSKGHSKAALCGKDRQHCAAVTRV